MLIGVQTFCLVEGGFLNTSVKASFVSGNNVKSLSPFLYILQPSSKNLVVILSQMMHKVKIKKAYKPTVGQ